jgi:sodium-coupled neutral amino acid transporter 11
LAKASALALVSMIVIVVTVITQGFRVPADSRGEIKSHLIFNSGFFQAVGVISFGMLLGPKNLYKSLILSHLQHSSAVWYPQSVERYQALTLLLDHNSLLIYGSLKKPTLDRFATVTHYSTGISLVMCLAMGIAGFLSFGSKTQGNVLNNFPSDNILVNIARL